MVCRNHLNNLPLVAYVETSQVEGPDEVETVLTLTWSVLLLCLTMAILQPYAHKCKSGFLLEGFRRSLLSSMYARRDR
jgi:hypothetical protein